MNNIASLFLVVLVRGANGCDLPKLRTCAAAVTSVVDAGITVTQGKRELCQAMETFTTCIDTNGADCDPNTSANLQAKLLVMRRKLSDTFGECLPGDAGLNLWPPSQPDVKANTKVAELKGEIGEQEEKKNGMQGQIKDFKSDKIADEKAISLIESAIGYMKDWKNAKKAALVSQRKLTMVAGALHEVVKPAFIQLHSASKQAADPQFVVGAGNAPPPPPATWDAGESYGGASGESAGVVGIMEMVKEDVKKDVRAAEDEEAESLKDFNKEKADLEDEIKATNTAIDAYKKDKASQEKDVVDRTGERSTSKDELNGQLSLYKSYKPGCDFLLVNFDTRTKARQIEVDGLQKAKAILKGGDFAKSFLQVTC